MAIRAEQPADGGPLSSTVSGRCAPWHPRASRAVPHLGDGALTRSRWMDRLLHCTKDGPHGAAHAIGQGLSRPQPPTRWRHRAIRGEAGSRARTRKPKRAWIRSTFTVRRRSRSWSKGHGAPPSKRSPSRQALLATSAARSRKVSRSTPGSPTSGLGSPWQATGGWHPPPRGRWRARAPLW